VQAVTLEAASFPHRVEGRLLPLDEARKESRAYRQPLGVIGVISPWNFPMYLSHRSIGPALALGNAVVVKPAASALMMALNDQGERLQRNREARDALALSVAGVMVVTVVWNLMLSFY
jgi:hypothetical protein